MLRSLAKFSESEASNHAPSLADFITTMVGFKVFGTHSGFFGWIFLILFLLFNGLMVVWLFSYWSTVLPMSTTGSQAGRAGAAIGTTLGTGFIISIWTCGSIVLGLFVLFTRGRKVIVEEQR
jgi:hypothetical protein